MFDPIHLAQADMKDTLTTSTIDRQYLDKAYSKQKGLYQKGNTLYVAGTKSLTDVLDDTLIPLQKTEMSHRYHDALAHLKKHPDVERVVGHSLGGAVALQLDKDKPYGVGYKTRTYGAPVFDMEGIRGERYRNPGDPVSIFDIGAHGSEKPFADLVDPLQAHGYHTPNYSKRRTPLEHFHIGSDIEEEDYLPDSAFTKIVEWL